MTNFSRKYKTKKNKTKINKTKINKTKKNKSVDRMRGGMDPVNPKKRLGLGPGLGLKIVKINQSDLDMNNRNVEENYQYFNRNENGNRFNPGAISSILSNFDMFVFDFDNTMTVTHTHNFPMKYLEGPSQSKILMLDDIDRFVRETNNSQRNKDRFLNLLFGHPNRRKYLVEFINFLITNGKIVVIATYADKNIVERTLDLLFGDENNPFKIARNNIISGDVTQNTKKIDLLIELLKVNNMESKPQRVLFFDDDLQNILAMKGKKKQMFGENENASQVEPYKSAVEHNLPQISSILLNTTIPAIPKYFNKKIIEKITDYLNKSNQQLPIPYDLIIKSEF